MFVDQVKVHLQGGNGGAGVAAFVRARGKPKGKPIGGDGGHGGDAIIRADAGMASLLTYQRNPHHTAGDGAHGKGDHQHGRRGEDLVLPVPRGTLIKDEDGTVLADLVEDGQELVVVRGGRGGRGNASFLSRTRRAPQIAEQGEYGRTRSLTLELKLIADVALVGYPNAGKSTLISRVSAANPKIADYPFTTLEPNLGVVEIDDRQFVMADIPGLIEGAASGKGLGHEFLRHVERARVLVVLLDPSFLQTDGVGTQLDVLTSELDSFSADLARRPRLTAISKGDSPEADEAAALLPDAMVISAMTGEGLTPFLHRVADIVDSAEREAPDRRGFVLHRPVERPITVRREGDAWRVEGLGAERAVAFSDLTIPEAADMAAKRLSKLGIDDLLRRSGAVDGDEVRIGDLFFEFEPDIGEEE
ncbi:MAG: GTPase ObgE [Acidimicrobiia bacterium]|nr:GTPase ObgE [Acidimicrobiia bacterium]